MMGFLYPLIGLLCFFLPVCCPPEVVTPKKLDDFAKESDLEYEADEAKFRAMLIATRAAEKQAMDMLFESQTGKKNYSK